MSDSIRNSGLLEIRDRLALVSGGSALDIGTQHGDFITTLMKSLKDYETFVGIDISEETLEKAKENFSDELVKFELMNAESLAFNDASFDTVCISFSIHHLENVDVVLGEMMRVLKQGGHLIIQEMFSDEDQSDAKLADMHAHHLGAVLDRMEGNPHYETLSRKQLNDLVNGLGLTKVEVYESTYGLKCLYCDNSEKCEDPLSEYNLKFGREEIGDTIQRAKDLKMKDIEKEAELLLEKIETTGYQSASQLFFICEK
jgi:2-polyprenyl-3-methyl-5-hydroxy-6-metoxy-1,4-benzoquinol methylase